MKKIDPRYLKIFLTVAACITFYFLLENLSAVSTFFRAFFAILRPVLYGFVIAYLLSPVMKFCEWLLVKLFRKGKGKNKATKIISLILAYLLAGILISLLILIVVPQLATSVSTLADNFSGYSKDFAAWVDNWIEKVQNLSSGDSIVSTQIRKILEAGEDMISSATGGLINLFPSAINFVTDLTTVVGYLIIGLILSIYMLADKERLISRAKKIIVSLMKKERADGVILFFREINETVGDFITGKILDSIIIGILSYVVFLIMDMSFAPLIAVIVGVTDVIPVFGPIIGAVPCGLILLFVNPGQVIPFVIAVIIIQQFDGNILGPKILSRATGVSGFWVMVSLTIGGGLFGVMGMILAVPVFGVFYQLFTKRVNARLAARELPVDTDSYYDYPYPPEPLKIENKKKNHFFRFGKNRKKAAPENPAPEKEKEENHADR